MAAGIAERLTATDGRQPCSGRLHLDVAPMKIGNSGCSISNVACWKYLGRSRGVARTAASSLERTLTLKRISRQRVPEVRLLGQLATGVFLINDIGP